MRAGALYVDIVGDSSRLQSAIGAIPGMLGGLKGLIAGLGIGAALAAEFSVANAASSKYETMLVKLSNAADLEGEALKGLRAELETLSVTLKGVSLEDLYGIATNASKAGVTGAGLMPFVEGVAKLSVAMDDIPADEIVDKLIKINSTFQLPIPQVANLGSAIDKLADSGTSDAKDIFEAAGRMAGVGKAAGLAVEDVLALSAASLETGASAEQSAGSIGRFLSAMASGQGVKAYAKQIGISVAEAVEEVQATPVVAMQKFLKTLDGKGLDEASRALKKLGIEGSEDAGVLLNLAGKMSTVGEYSRLAAEQIRTGEQALASYAKAAATSDSGSVQLANAMEIMHRKLGDSLSPAVSEFNSLLAKMAVDLSKGETAFRSLEKAAIDAVDKMKAAYAVGVPGARLGFREWANQYLPGFMQFETESHKAKAFANLFGGVMRDTVNDTAKNMSKPPPVASKPEEEAQKKQDAAASAAQARSDALDKSIEELEYAMSPDRLFEAMGLDMSTREGKLGAMAMLADFADDAKIGKKEPKQVEIQGFEDRIRSVQMGAGKSEAKEMTEQQKAANRTLNDMLREMGEVRRNTSSPYFGKMGP